MGVVESQNTSAQEKRNTIRVRRAVVVLYPTSGKGKGIYLIFSHEQCQHFITRRSQCEIEPQDQGDVEREKKPAEQCGEFPGLSMASTKGSGCKLEEQERNQSLISSEQIEEESPLGT